MTRYKKRQNKAREMRIKAEEDVAAQSDVLVSVLRNLDREQLNGSRPPVNKVRNRHTLGELEDLALWTIQYLVGELGKNPTVDLTEVLETQLARLISRCENPVTGHFGLFYTITGSRFRGNGINPVYTEQLPSTICTTCITQVIKNVHADKERNYAFE